MVKLYQYTFYLFIYFNWRIITVLWCILPYIDMNQPQVYLCPPPSWNSLPSPSPPYPYGLSHSTGFGCPFTCFELALLIYFTFGNAHVSIITFLNFIYVDAIFPTSLISLYIYYSLDKLLSISLSHYKNSAIYMLVHAPLVLKSWSIKE